MKLVNCLGKLRKSHVAFVLLTASLLVFTGCAIRYDVTLSNGLKWTNVTKPVLDDKSGEYVFVDGFGKTVRIKESRIRVIEPHEESTETSQFKNSSDIPKASSK